MKQTDKRVTTCMLIAAFIMLIHPSTLHSANRHVAYGENIGWINLEPDDGPGIITEGSYIEGLAWGENIGWIHFSPSEGGVSIDAEGNLSGHAWGENVGWISLSCENNHTCSTVDYGVSYQKSTGLFSGYGWGENIGWITFPDSAYREIRLPLRNGFNLFYFPTIYKKPFTAEDKKIIEKLYHALPAHKTWEENSYNLMKPDSLNAIYASGAGILYLDLKDESYPIVNFCGFIDAQTASSEVSDPNQCIDETIFDLAAYIDPNGSTLEIMKNFTDIESITGQHSRSGKQEASYRFFGERCGKNVDLKSHTSLVHVWGKERAPNQ
jgi:hypothetical protein